MNRDEGAWGRFCAWVNGDREEVESRLFSIGRAPRQEKQPEEEPPKQGERQRLQGFLGWYPLASAVIGLTIVGILIATVLVLPPFGHADNPTNNEVPAHYLRNTREETGASNAVAGLILNYRGFDTFGESCVLFLAVSSVFMLLREEKGGAPRKLRTPRRDGQEDIILKEVSAVLVPLILLFGLYMLLGGHHSPGGGFSGGAVLGGALILYASAFGQEAMGRFFNERVYNAVRLAGLLLYAVLFGYYIFMGANGLDNRIPLELGGLILPIDIAVGMVVACTIYGFYAMFTRGDI